MKNVHFVIKSILMVCCSVYFLGAENGKISPEPKCENPIIAQPKEEKIWRIFGSVQKGWIFGERNNLSDIIDKYGDTTYGYVKNYSRAYFGVDFGTEFVFKNGNGFNVLLNIDSQSLAIGANYIYELTGKYKYAFITGFDIGDQREFVWGGSPSFQTTAPLIRYNLGVRYRYKRQAFSIMAKIPLYESTLLNYEPYYSYPSYEQKNKNYAGVAFSVMYSFFFKLY